MSWQPEDWSEWAADRWVSAYPDDSRTHAVREILLRLPDREHRTALELTRGPSIWLPFLDAHFARAASVARPVDGAALAPPGSCYLLLAVDTIDVVRLGGMLLSIRDTLVEGGILLATFSASVRGGAPFEMIGRPPESGLHEVQLQYRLRGAGFQGLRMRRLPGDGETLLCMAVRRALN